MTELSVGYKGVVAIMGDVITYRKEEEDHMNVKLNTQSIWINAKPSEVPGQEK